MPISEIQAAGLSISRPRSSTGGIRSDRTAPAHQGRAALCRRVTGVDEHDNESWDVEGTPSGEALTRARTLLPPSTVE